MSSTVFFEITTAASAEDVTQILRETLQQTAAFDGNQGVRVLVDDSAPRRLVVEMTWSDLTRYDAYLAWRQTPAGANRLMGILDGAPVTRRFSATIDIGRPAATA